MGRITTVEFREDTIFAVERDDGIFVAIKPINDSLGLNWRRQLERLKSDPVLGKGMSLVDIPSPGGAQETTVLRLNLIPGWLFKIDSRRVNDASKAKLIAYQEECYAVLHAHFFGQGRRMPAAVPDDVAQGDGLKLRKVAEARMSFGSRSAAQLWFQLGLDVVPAMFDVFRQKELFQPRDITPGVEPAEEGEPPP